MLLKWAESSPGQYAGRRGLLGILAPRMSLVCTHPWPSHRAEDGPRSTSPARLERLEIGKSRDKTRPRCPVRSMERLFALALAPVDRMHRDDAPQ